ncbi:MAG: PHP domain-containing protein [Clostridiales bacterium]|nr:PHP domain-containing protein [Clostridiales bacterium]
MKKADLHMHSRISDGSWTIEELAHLAAEKGVDTIAVTEHDTLSQMRKIPEGLPVQVIPGIEISAFDYDANMRVHVLGYHIQNISLVEELVHPLLLARHENSMRQIAVLQENGFTIDVERLHRADGAYIYKQHIMEYLVKTGQAPDMFGDFYRRTFKNGGICAFDIRYLDPYVAVRTVKEAGGLAVLAHSGQQQNFSLIPRLVQEGLAGLELHHPANSEKDQQIIRKYAAEYNLFLTGGSDCHGDYEPNSPNPGYCLSEESGVAAIC